MITVFDVVLSLKTTITLPNSEGTRQRWFLFYKHLHFKKLEIKKKLSQSNFFKIWYEYSKNNYILILGYGIHIKIVWFFSNAVKTHNVNIFHKILATGRPVAKILIKYKYNLEENDEEEKEPVDLEFAEQKADPYNDENAIDFRWSDVKEDEEDIALANFNKNLQKQADEESFPIK